ncbi:MAG: peptidyl-prolyl cis-trans isomerase [Myxococcales bacterium]|nr:peptidyl-prolyl cis-trans isomerase [Myxococcales bacterium]
MEIRMPPSVKKVCAYMRTPPFGHGFASFTDRTAGPARQAAALGAALAFSTILAACGGLKPPPVDLTPHPPKESVALVNDRPVAPLQASVLAASGASPPSADPTEAAIVEELMVQEAERRGMATQDPGLIAVRLRLVERRFQEAADSVAVGDRALRRLYKARLKTQHRDDRVRVEILFFRFGADVDRARRRVAEAREALARGTPVVDVKAGADRPLTPLPEGPISLKDLRTLWGPRVAAEAAELRSGHTSDPIDVPGGVALVRLVERIPSPPPTFASQRTTLEESIRRDLRSRARETLLASLRERVPVEILPAADAAAPLLGSTPSAVVATLAETGTFQVYDPGAGPVIARVGGTSIHQGAVDARVARTFSADAGRFASQAERRAALDEIVEATLIDQEAVRMGLGHFDRAYRTRAAAVAMADALGVRLTDTLEMTASNLDRLRAWIEELRAGAHIQRQ